MAIARVFEATGWSTDQYDELIRRMDLGGHSGRGVLFNWATVTATGIRVTDVYDDIEAADALAQEKVGPLVAELGLSMPEITQFEVHSYLAPSS